MVARAVLEVRGFMLKSGECEPLEDVQREGFTTPLLTEANKRRNTKQFTKKKPRCQRGGVRGVA